MACTDKTDHNECIQINVQDYKGMPASDMVVYLQPLSGQQLSQSDEIVTVTQQNEAFAPYITVSQTKKQVNFVNQDDITHQIYSADSDNRFSFTIRAGSEHLANAFDHEAEISMGCNIHDWMSGYLLVVDTPYFAKTDAQGQVRFSLSELGQYNIVVWHPQLPTQEHRVIQPQTITQSAEYNVSLTKKLDTIPTQQHNDDFDFLSGY